MIYSGLQLRVYRMLQGVVWTRERRRKDEALVSLLTSNWTFERPPTKEALIELVRDYNTADRFWRKLLEVHPEIRGQDYLDKRKYAEKKKIELGFEVGYSKDILMHKKI